MLYVGLHTRGSIRVHDCYSFLAGTVLEETFLSAIVACASQACEVEEDRHFAVGLSGGGR